MRVLLTNFRLTSRSGSEMYLFDVARWLRDHGHIPVVYAARLGPMAEVFRRDGIAVTDDLATIAERPDVIHGQHHIATLTALTWFSGVPAVAFCHGWLPWEELPVRHPQVRRYVAVSGLTRERLVSERGISPQIIRVIPNFVDVTRFRQRESRLPDRPKRALIYSTFAKVDAPWVEEVRAACSARGIAVDVAGPNASGLVTDPEALLATYDLVFARGRSALEAMASGAAVIVCDIEGLAGLVTPQTFEVMRDGNFGRQVQTRPNERVLIGAEIEKYDPQVTTQTTEVVRSTLGSDLAIEQIVAAYLEAIDAAVSEPVSAEATSRAVAEYLRELDATHPVPHPEANGVFALERTDLQRALQQARSEANAERETSDRLRAELKSINEQTAQANRQAARTRAELDALRSGFLVSRVLPLAWRMRARVAPAGSHRDRVVRAATGRRRPAPGRDDKKEPAAASRPATPVSLSAVVLDVCGQETLVESAASLVAQEPRPQIVVVSSGGGDAEAQIAAAGMPVDIVTSSIRLMPGAARNLGIAATSGSHIAFVAADCVTAPGWAAGRIDAHALGARAVASAVVNDRPANPFATAAHVSLFPSRLPGTPPAERLFYGASYWRGLFEDFGRFRDDLRVGEDTEFHERVVGKASFVFRPDVLVAHRNPRSLPALLADQFGRGARAAVARHELYGEPAAVAQRRVARAALTRLGRSARLAWVSLPPRERVGLAIAAPFLLPAAAAYSAGAALGGASGAATTREAGPGRAHGPIRLIGLVAFRDERRHMARMLDNVATHVDAIVALDDGSSDGSTQIAATHPKVIELIRYACAGEHRWNERRNKRILVDAAIRHEAQWAIAVDADERLERDFRERADPIIDAADRAGIRAFHVRVRELWDSDRTYRADGLWGKKRSARLFRVPQVYDAGELELHGAWAPPDTRPPNADWSIADLELHHLAMVTPEDRVARRTKYERIDPDRRWQQVGYAYLTDDAGLELAPISAERHFAREPA